MIYIICTFIVCITAITAYGMSYAFRALELTEEEQPKQLPSGRAYEEVPKLARKYLDAAEKLEEKAVNMDLKGFSALGDLNREEARSCRQKAQEIIKTASNS
jgi:hypothetical protein